MFSRRRRSAAADYIRLARQAYQDGPLSEERAARARSLLKQASASLEGDRTEQGMRLSAEVAELKGLQALRRLDLEPASYALLAAAAYRSQIDRMEDRSAVTRVSRSLADFYASLGDWATASQLQISAMLQSPAQEWSAYDHLLVAIYEENAGQRDSLSSMVDTDPSSFVEPLRSLHLLAAQRAGKIALDLLALTNALDRVVDARLDVRTHCTLYAVNHLVTEGRVDLGIDHLRKLRGDINHEPVQAARVSGALGAVLARTGNYTEALPLLLEAWVVMDEVRVAAGSMKLRHAVNARLAQYRRGALDAAVNVRDHATVFELIQASRLGATMLLEGRTEDFDQHRVPETFLDRSPSGKQKARPSKSSKIPPALGAAVIGLFDDRSDLSDPVDVYVGGRSRLAEARQDHAFLSARAAVSLEDVVTGDQGEADDGFWWSMWVERGFVYWSLSEAGVPADSGKIDVRSDEPLRQTLVKIGGPDVSPWRVDGDPSAGVPLVLIADSREERTLIEPLSRLLPPGLNRSDGPVRRLIMSVAPELSAVPWPVVRIGSHALGNDSVRLVERYRPHHLPALSVVYRATKDNRMPDRPLSDNRPLDHLLTCDYLPNDAGQDFPPPVLSRAQREMLPGHYAANFPGSIEASTDNLAHALRHMTPGELGVAFFRCHANLVVDNPAESWLSLSDGAFPFGILGVRDSATGKPMFGLPNTVVLACCSTSGLRARSGGEALGFTSVALVAGARRVFATAIDLPQNEFTTSLDGHLIELATVPGDHFELLRSLHVELLSQWRHRRDPGDVDDFPSPFIWGYYQAFGV